MEVDGKLTYTTWLRFFYEADVTCSGFIVEAFLAYWLSWYFLPSEPEDGLNQHVFPLAIIIAKGIKFALDPLFLGSLYVRLDECIGNITRLVGNMAS